MGKDFLTAIRLSTTQHKSRYPCSRGQDPDAHVYHLGLEGSAEIQGFHGVAHGHVAVHTHHGEGEDTGEHVVVVDGDEDLAYHLAEGPRVQKVVSALEWHRGGDEGVGECQVENIDIGGRLHLRVPVQYAQHKVVL